MTRIIGSLLLAVSVHGVAGWLLLGSSESLRQEWRRPTTAAERTAPPSRAKGGQTKAVPVIADVVANDSRKTTPGQAPRLVIDVAVDPVTEGEPELVFRLHLSHPARQSIAILFATLDGTARAGIDYQPRDGMLTVPSGTEWTELRMPLINDDLREADEQFELFLSADPNIAEVSSPRVLATILDDD